MAVGLNADADYLHVSGQLGAIGISQLTFCVWHLRNGTVNADIGLGAILGVEANAGRYQAARFDNTFGDGTRNAPQFAVYDHVGHTDFAAPDQPPFDVWIFYILRCGVASGIRTVEWSEYGSATWHTQTMTTNVEGSVTPERVLVGRALNSDATTSYGHYAYARAFNSEIGETASRALKMSGTVGGTEWGFWELTDNASLSDTSGNGRHLTGVGSLTTETSPTMDAPAGGLGAAISRLNVTDFPKKFMRRLS